MHLVSLRPELEGLIVPSKLCGIMAAGRPCIFIGDPHGEVAEIVARVQCGFSIRQGDGEGLAAAICEFAANPDLRQTMGENARRGFEQEFERSVAIEKWADLLAELAPQNRPAAVRM